MALHEVEHAVAADAEQREIGGNDRRRVALADRRGALIADNEQATRGIEGKGPRREAVCIGILNERGLAGRLVDPEHRDLVPPAGRWRTAVADVDEPSAGM